MGKTIAYVGPFSYPASNANSLRVHGVARALAAQGNQLLIGSADPETAAPGCDLPAGITVFRLGELPDPAKPKLSRVLQGMFWGGRTCSWLATLSPKPDAIILYGTPIGYLGRLLVLAKKLDIPLFLDVVEWYQAAHQPGGRLGPFALANELSMRYLSLRADKVIVISTYLKRHYESGGCRTLVLPPLFPEQPERPAQFRDTAPGLHLCYAGSPGKKDFLAAVIEAFYAVRQTQPRLFLHLVGITDRYVDDLVRGLSLPQDDSPRRRITCYGVVPNPEAKRVIASCDFLVLVRPTERYAMAGFPSKVSESLMLGTPIISNVTSDLDRYLTHGRDCIFIKDSGVPSIKEAIENALALPCEALRQMKEAARVTGNANFSISAHAGALNRFLFPHEKGSADLAAVALNPVAAASENCL